MRRTSAFLFSLIVLASCTSATAGTTASVEPASSEPALTSIGAGLTGPAGIAATVFATGLGDVASLTFDPAGRLWVATAAYDDAGSDGVYLVNSAGSTPVKVIANLHTVLGLAWSGDILYVASSGRVDAYGGLSAGAFTEHSTVITLPTGVGSANGLVLSRQGRLVLGVSAPCDACTPTSDYAAAVISFLPDGGDLRVEASGIRAPVGLAYYPGTDDLFVTMNQRDDLGDATPGDWLAVVRSGQAWGFPDCYGQGGSACVGVPAPVAELDAHAAVSGVAVVTGELGDAVGNAAIVAEWATGKVLRVSLTAAGDTYTGVVEPFLTGLTKPVPVVLAPDGSVLVGDWGSGTIYRVTAA
jgi:glucose/arabinose dehydrogenase